MVFSRHAALAHHPAKLHFHPFKQQRADPVRGIELEGRAIGAFRGLAVHPDCARRDVDEPDLGDAEPGVERQFALAVVAGAAVGSRLSRLVRPACGGAMGGRSIISPSISSTLVSGSSTPASPMRENSSTVTRCGCGGGKAVAGMAVWVSDSLTGGRRQASRPAG
jgi:hypothetical protein